MSTSEKFIENSAKFSGELFATIAKSDDPTKNIIISPLSVQTCVALAYAGATGETAQEMVKGLHLVSDNKEEVAASYAEFLDSLNSSPLVKIANKIYVNQNYKLRESYKEITGKYFHSEADTLDVSDVNAAANKVNQWKFDPENTMKEQFYYSESDSVEVDMMTQKSKFRYGAFEDLEASVLELPYADSNLSMLIVLPNSRTGLKEVGSKLKTKSIFEISQNMYETEVSVMLPKFKVDYSVELTEPLKKMGMTKMFSNGAEFGNMLEEPEELKVSKVLHKAFIEVNEEGTEAAAATGMIMMMRCALVPELPTEFIADHPFIYVIWDKKNIFSVQSSSSKMFPSKKFKESSVKFSGELFSTIADSDNTTENIIISPLTVQTCVAMAYAGAIGETAQEMIKGLHLVSDNKEKVAASYVELLDSLNSSPLVKIANKIYVNQDYKLRDSYKKITGKYFHSEADTLDVSDANAAANKVNKWVEEKTNNKIQNLISPDNINDLTRLVLVNAIYFKGNWAKKFRPNIIMKKPFYYSESDSMEVYMMSQKSKLRYGAFEDLEASVLELPYTNSNFSMLIILPNSRTGLKDVATKLKSKSIFKISKKMNETEVSVMLPKFKFDYSVELTEPLKKMGITKMFSNGAEFGNMLKEPEELKVSKVLHKAFIEINEEGTEAAAATGELLVLC
uniref:Serpin domain-containing protein n=1 Tax=Megaselia scalaris TaxID=36166 RepID=T1GWS3_MEGSC